MAIVNMNKISIVGLEAQKKPDFKATYEPWVCSD